MIIQVCIGSSCHLRGSASVIALLKQAIEDHHLENEITLSASFCIGKCNPNGATVQVDDDIHVGINKENFDAFLQEQVLKKLGKE